MGYYSLIVFSYLLLVKDCKMVIVPSVKLMSRLLDENVESVLSFGDCICITSSFNSDVSHSYTRSFNFKNSDIVSVCKETIQDEGYSIVTIYDPSKPYITISIEKRGITYESIDSIDETNGLFTISEEFFERIDSDDK